MFIRSSDVESTHDHHHNLGKVHSTAAAAAATTVTKVNRDSHLIKKSTPTPLTSPPLTTVKTKTHPRQPQPPLIIYAHAPRVIHTKPQEFKALVQTLTGYTGNKKTTTTKNDHQSPPPPHPPTSLLPPPPSKPPMYYDFEEFETKNVVPLINNNNNIFSLIQDGHKQNTSMMDENLNINFTAPIFDQPLMMMHQANSSSTSLPIFTPTYVDQLCCTNNNNNFNSGNSVGFVGKLNNKDEMLYDENYVGAETGSGSGSGCYYSDGLSSSFDLSSTLSSVEEAIDELTDFC